MGQSEQRLVGNESEKFWDPGYEGLQSTVKIELLHQMQWGTIGAFVPDFHLKDCLTAELRIEDSWQKWKQ